MRRAARVLKTGVRIEQHPDPEPKLRERIDREPRTGEGSDALRAGLEAHGRGEVVYVRGILFVDVELDGEHHRWEWTPSPPEPVWSVRFYPELLRPLGWRWIHEVVGERGETIHYLFRRDGHGSIGIRERQSEARCPTTATP